jgi:sigma-E factor negative regulatory protein RseC
MLDSYFLHIMGLSLNCKKNESVMMHELGKVKSIDGVIARVVVARKSSCCESCEKDVCDIPDDGIETEAINEAGAKTGQKVKIVMKSYTFIKGAILLYVLPVFSLISGAILGKMYLPAYFVETDSDLLAALAGFVFFIISLLIIIFLADRMNKKTEYRSVIESIVEE